MSIMGEQRFHCTWIYSDSQRERNTKQHNTTQDLRQLSSKKAYMYICISTCKHLTPHIIEHGHSPHTSTAFLWWTVPTHQTPTHWLHTHTRILALFIFPCVPSCCVPVGCSPLHTIHLVHCLLEMARQQTHAANIHTPYTCTYIQ